MRAILPLLLLCLAGAARAQTPATALPGQIATPSAAATDAKAEAAGTIRGRILLAGGRPARRASVRTTPLSTGVEQQVAADLDGRYEFTGVAPGDYQIGAGTPGYLALEYGQRRAFERGTAVTLRNGETLERIDIALPASGAISGQVVDENGDPIEGIDVQLMHLQFGANRRQLLPVNGVRRRVTDDRGHYRLYGVPPGRYVVLASVAPRPGAQTPAILPSGYVPTYYPGTEKGSDAKTLAIDLSDNADGIDLAMVRMRTARISGTVVDASGKSLRTTVLAMTSQRSGGLSSGNPLSAGTLADGTFEIRDVPPGEWVLQAANRGDVYRGQEGEFASRFVTVEGADVRDVHLQTSIGSRVDGRIVFEGRGAADPTSVTITTLPSDFDRAPMTGPPGMCIGRADGTFVLEGLNGPRRFRLMRAPDGWSLKAIRVNGIEVAETPMSFGTKDESLIDVEVILTKSASISGSVTDTRSQPVVDYAVIVFATSAERWYQGSRFFTFTRPKSDGTFAVANLPPGEYYVAAVDRMQGTDGFGEWQDPAFLQSIAPRGVRLTLSDGQSASITTQLIVR